jgi:hypothetical protein
MITLARRLSIAVAGLGLVSGMAACGDNVTGPVTWRSVVTETLSQVPQGSNSVRSYDVISGDVRDTNNHVLPGQQFRESCYRIYVGGKLKQDWNCLAVVNTGPHLYVAGGHAAGITGELPVLDDPKVGGAFFISFDGAAATSPRTNPFRVRIVEVQGSGEHCARCA